MKGVTPGQAREGFVCVAPSRRVGFGAEGSSLGGIPAGEEHVGVPRWVPVGEVDDTGMPDRPTWVGDWRGVRVQILHPRSIGLPAHPEDRWIRPVVVSEGPVAEGDVRHMDGAGLVVADWWSREDDTSPGSDSLWWRTCGADEEVVNE